MAYIYRLGCVIKHIYIYTNVLDSSYFEPAFAYHANRKPRPICIVIVFMCLLNIDIHKLET